MKKQIFMLKKLFRDFQSFPSQINTDLTSELNYYYFKFESNPKKLNRLISSFDKPED